MRGMATLPQGNQELLEVRDKVGRPRWAWGKQVVVVVVVEYLYSASRSASNALIVPQRCEEMSL